MPGRLQSKGSHRVGHYRVTKHTHTRLCRRTLAISRNCRNITVMRREKMNVGWYEISLEGDPRTTLCRILWVIAMNYVFVSTLISYVDILMLFVTAHGLSLVCSEYGLFFIVVFRFLIAVASLVAEYRL